MANKFKHLNPSEVQKILMDMGGDSPIDFVQVTDKTRYNDLLSYLDRFSEHKKKLGLKFTDSLGDEAMGRVRTEVFNDSSKVAAKKAASNTAEFAKRRSATMLAKSNIAEAAAKRLAQQQTTKESLKQVGKNLVKTVAGASAAPAVGMASTGALIADVAAGTGLAGEKAKLGHTLMSDGEEAAYNQWVEKRGYGPTYQQYKEASQKLDAVKRPTRNLKGSLKD